MTVPHAEYTLHEDNVCVFPWEKNGITHIKPLLSGYEFSDYRAYRFLSRDMLTEYLFKRFSASMDQEDNLILIATSQEQKGEIIGLITLRPLPWDSAHFGCAIGEVGGVIALQSYPYRRQLKKILVEHITDISRRRGFSCLFCRIDGEDNAAICALENTGFRMMDTLVTYVFNRFKHTIPEIKDTCAVRPFCEKDLAALMRLAEHSFSKDRFHIDPNIPDEKADRLFAKWIENSCWGAGAERFFVAERKGEAAGFLSFDIDADLEKISRYRIGGHGLSAVAKTAKGAYLSLVKAAMRKICAEYDCLEFDTQLYNYEVIKIWQRFGFDFIRAKHTFHKWFKE